MKGIISKIKALKDNKKLLNTLQLVFLGVILFLAFDQSVLNEIRLILEMLNVRNVDKVISNGLLIYKAIFDASNLYTIVMLTIKVLLSFITFVALIVLFISVVEKFIEKKEKQNYNTEAVITANYKAVYLKQEKFLC